MKKTAQPKNEQTKGSSSTNPNSKAVVKEWGHTFWFVCYPESYNVATVADTCNRLGFDFVYVLHDRDVADDGKPKKAHYHVLIDCHRSFRLSSFKRAFDVDYAEIIASTASHALRYMTHTSPDSVKDGKTEYPLSCLVSSYPLDVLQGSLTTSALCTFDESQALADADELAHGRISSREFLLRNPQALYKFNALQAGLRGLLDDEAELAKLRTERDQLRDELVQLKAVNDVLRHTVQALQNALNFGQRAVQHYLDTDDVLLSNDYEYENEAH